MTSSPRSEVVLVVDAANVVGSRPDGWWRDRAGAARRLLAGLEGLVGREVTAPTGEQVAVAAVGVVLEGQARPAVDAAGRLPVLLAPASGDDALVELVEEVVPLLAPPAEVVLVTADRGLRARVRVASWGPRWLHETTGGPGPRAGA